MFREYRLRVGRDDHLPMIESAHQHDCPIAPGVALSANIAHGEYDQIWMRSLKRKAASEWKTPRDSQRAKVYRAEHAVSVAIDEENLGSVQPPRPWSIG